MEYVKWIDYKGKKILVGNLENIGPKEWHEANRQYEEIMKEQKENSILALVKTENSRFDAETISGLKERSKKDAPYIKKTAVMGISGLKKVMFSAVMQYSGRNAKLFENEQEAMDWLVSDGE